jgi:hypothetical protein
MSEAADLEEENRRLREAVLRIVREIIELLRRRDCGEGAAVLSLHATARRLARGRTT